MHSNPNGERSFRSGEATLLLAAVFFAASTQTAFAVVQTAEQPAGDVVEESIWDRPIPESDLTYSDLIMPRNSASPDSEPVLVPLPSPVIAAGVGLLAALLVRRKLRN